MELIEGGKKIAGASVGDSVMVIFIDGTIERIVLNNVDRYGVEGFSKRLLNSPLEMYPWSTIKKVRKESD